MSTDINRNAPPSGAEAEVINGGNAAEVPTAQGGGGAGGSPPPPSSPLTNDRAVSAQAITAIPGAFTLDDEHVDQKFAGDNFNLRPLDNRLGPIPDDQRKISHEVYVVRNTLKFLYERKQRLATIAEKDYEEFIERVKQAARVGCTGVNVDTVLAATALDDIRGDVVQRYGRKIAFHYLLVLAAWAAGGILLGFIVIGTLRWSGLEALSGYGYLLIGSMVGAWLSVASSRWEIAFDGIPEFMDMSAEPPVRLLFVGLLAMTFGLFLQLGIIPIKIGEVSLKTFNAMPQWALLLGIIAGVGERALSMQLLTRAKQVFTTTS